MKRLLVGLLISLVLLAGCVGPSVPAPLPAPAPISPAPTQQAPTPKTVIPSPSPTPKILSTGDVVKKVSPAVVLIVTDDGSGTGMFISSDGYVLTNEHVVSESHYATLNLPDKRSIQAEVIYRHQALDIAILKSAGINYPVVTLGSTTEPVLGEDVVALGFPSATQLGDSVSVSKGIISAFRTIDGVNYIQSDVSLNPGSSGGPMVNMHGEVIGMNIFKLRETEGIGFAININSIKMRIESIVQQHKDGLLAVEKPPLETKPPVQKAEEKTDPSTPPKVEWTKTFGGTDADAGKSVQQTSDGGYIITGWTSSFGVGAGHVYLVKTDSSGNMLWSKTFGGSGVDIGYSVQQTSDGGYIITGSTESFGAGSLDVYLIKTDSSGIMTWSKTFGGAKYDVGYSVQQTSDGGYIIGGYTSSFGDGLYDFYVVRTDSLGIMTWSKTFGGANYDVGRSIQQTLDGGYVITGYASSFGDGEKVYLVKIDSSGNMTWQKTFGGASSGSSVRQTADGGYIIAGRAYSSGNGDVYLIKTDASGNMTWQKTFGGTDSDDGYSVQQTSDGGYIIAGYTYSFSTGNGDAYLIKTDASGNMTWQKTFGGANVDVSCSVQQTADGGYIIAGETPSFGAGSADVWLIKVK